MHAKILNMNYKIYFLFITSLVFISCKSDVKPDIKPDVKPETTTTVKENTSSLNNGGSVLNADDKPKSSIAITEAKIIDVASIAEIVSKADHNTTLRLKKGKYELPDNLVYYISKEKKEIIDKNTVDTRSVGGQIFISGMTNFSIIGNNSEVNSNNPIAVPLFILKGNKGEIKNLSVGHKISSKKLSNVPSLYVSNSSNMNFSNCILGNSSKTGIKINDSKFITFTNCNISKTHSQIMEIYKGESIQFVNSVYENNDCAFPCFNFLGTENIIEFNNVSVINNIFNGNNSNNYDQIITGPTQDIKFIKSKFKGNKNFSDIGIDNSKLIDSEVQTF